MSQVEQRIGSRKLILSNVDKVLYPQAGFTKGQLLDYYVHVAPVMLPHLRDRTVTFKRYPNGVEEHFFFEKNCPRFRPPWMATKPVVSERTGATTDYCVLNDLASLVWAANLAVIEFHTTLGKVQRPERPTVLVFDLDPGEGADLRTCAKVALKLRRLVEPFALELFPKTSGRKGLQLYVPLNGNASFEETKSFGLAAAELLQRQHPELVVTKIKKAQRSGKVLIDWAQNDPNRSTICVYSLRAAERPTISTPVTWDEVEQAARSRRANVLRFEPKDVLARVEKDGDLFAPVLRLKQTLPAFH